MSDSIFKDRTSVRTYLKDQVPKNKIVGMLEAARYAPSPKNEQNWHYVIIQDQTLIQMIAKTVEEKHNFIMTHTQDTDLVEKSKKMLKYYTLFKGAPTLILVYCKHYRQDEVNLLKEIGEDKQSRALKEMMPGLQGVSASLQNFMLAARQVGYGTCWMTGPGFASKAIEALVSFNKEGYHLVALTPLGKPSKVSKSPKRKSVEEISTWI